MKKEQILSFTYKKLTYKIDIFFIVLSVILTTVAYFFYDKKASQLLVIVGFVFLIIVTSKFKEIYKLKELQFYNSLIEICKIILNDKTIKDKSVEMTIEFASRVIIQDMILKYNKKSWEQTEKEIDEPYAISYGNRKIYEILLNASDYHINSAKNSYVDFKIEKIEKYKIQAIDFEQKTKIKTNKRFELAEKRASKTGKDVFDIINFEEDNYKEKINSAKEKIKNEEAINDQRNLQLVLGICPKCFSKIPRLASKCPKCTADL